MVGKYVKALKGIIGKKKTHEFLQRLPENSETERKIDLKVVRGRET